MSWYTDTQLFIYEFNNGICVYRITKEFGCPVVPNDLGDREALTFSKHLSLGNNRESDYDAFKSSFSKKVGVAKAINSQGSVLNWNGSAWTWSREELDSPFYNLPGITKQESVTELLAEKQALKEKVSELEAKISSLQDEAAESNKDEKQAMDKRLSNFQVENTTLKDEVKRLTNGLSAEKGTDQKHEEVLARFSCLEAQVLDLTSKLVQCCGAGGGSSAEEPWISGRTVPSNWVPFEELDVQNKSKITPLTVTKATGATKVIEDKTTNVQSGHFYGGVYPIVLVNVKELTPNREEARFDPYVWSLYNNAGISYAAREPFASEMSVDAHKTN